MKLNELRDNFGSRHRRMRVGRGPGSGKGKTCGRGVKGQTSRSGVAIKGFEGGQMPIYRRLPKRGMRKFHQDTVVEISTDRILHYFDSGLLENGIELDENILYAKGVLSKKGMKVKVLSGTSSINREITLKVWSASSKAKQMILDSGGFVLESSSV